MNRLLIVTAAVIGLFPACFEENPCDRYVDYMCDCHADDPEFDCAELNRIYASADPALQDQCAVELTSQQDQDDDDGLVCGVDGTDTGDFADTGDAAR